MHQTFDVLIGLRVSIIRHAADTLILHFGDVRAHHSGRGTVGAYALHVQCPWRLDGSDGTVTGSDDRWEYAGPGERPSNWYYEDGPNLQDKRLDSLFGPRDHDGSWMNQSSRFVVTSVQQAIHGDVRLELSGDYVVLLFPASCEREAWRLFAPQSDNHLVFPVEKE